MKLDRSVNLARVGGQWFGLKVNPTRRACGSSRLADGTFGPLHDNSLTVA